jgi:hypothetical protein
MLGHFLAAECLEGQTMDIGRALIIFGIVLVAVGFLWPVFGRLGLGRLPGDIVIEREGFRLYVPITTSLLISAVLTLGFWLFRK